MPMPTAISRARYVMKTKFHQSSIINRQGRRPAVALLAGLALAGCQLDAAPITKVERPVQVQRVAFEDSRSSQEFVGVVRARHETDLGFRVAGKIGARLVNVGDWVRAGDVVARLDPEDLRLQVQIASAELSSARSALAQASADLERYRTLKTSGYASVADFDRKNAAKDEAQGRLDRAVRSLDLARNQLGYTTLTASADGIITATPAEPGQVVAIGQPVVRLAHRGEKEAVVALPETWLEHARAAEARVGLWSAPGNEYSARLRELSPQSDPATRTYAARFTIEDADDAVALGMTATVTLAQGASKPAARLPLAAILNRGAGASVYVVRETGELALRPVTVAAFNESAALITAGLAPGESVVTLGVQMLHEGQKVRVIGPQ
jgi:RND family efflux transporter MFP subunit